MPVHVPQCTRRPWNDDAAGCVSSKNQLFSFGTLTGILTAATKLIGHVQVGSNLFRVVSYKLPLEEAACADSTLLKIR